MNRNDWMGLATSFTLHALLLLLFTFMTAAGSEPQPQPLSLVEVELGAFGAGRPVRRGQPGRVPEEPKRSEPEPKKPAARPEPPRQARPVRLPQAPQDVPDPDKVESPQTERISPETRSNPDEPRRQQEPQREAEAARRPTTGARDGTAGAASGDQGTGTDEQQGFDIEGLLNRTLVARSIPSYSEKVNAVIVFSIQVTPQGNVVNARPIRKGSPVLEDAIRVALSRWRFNPLPANAPQVNQTGTVTFRFRLE